MTTPDPDQGVIATKLDELAAASKELSDRSLGLTETARAEIVASKAQRRRFMIVMAAIAVLVLAVLTAVFVVVVTGLSSRHSLNSTTRAILDCTQPAGQCYKDGQKRYGEAIGSVQQIVVLAAACAPSYVALPLERRTVAIEDCIKDGLK